MSCCSLSSCGGSRLRRFFSQSVTVWSTLTSNHCYKLTVSTNYFTITHSARLFRFWRLRSEPLFGTTNPFPASRVKDSVARIRVVWILLFSPLRNYVRLNSSIVCKTFLLIYLGENPQRSHKVLFAINQTNSAVTLKQAEELIAD